MAPVPFGPFVRACEAAETDTLVAFVAALYRERGWTVERRRSSRVVLSRGQERRTIAVPDGKSSDWNDADVLVGVPDGQDGRPIDDTHVLELADLHEQLRYAIDPDAGARIAENHLDVGVETGGDGMEDEGNAGENGTTDPDDRGEDGAYGATSPWASEGTRRTAVVGILVLAVVASIAWGTLVASDERRDIADSGAVDGTVTPATPAPRTPDDGSAVANGSVDTDDLAEYAAESRVREWEETDLAGTGDEVDRSNLSVDPFPPGILRDGGMNGTALSRTYGSSLSNDSHTVVFSYREQLDGRVEGQYTERIHVGEERYRTTTGVLGEFHTSVHRIAGVDSYADGALFTRRNGTVTRDATRPERIRNRIGATVRRYASADSARIIDGRTDDDLTTYQLVTSGHEAAWTRNTTGTVFLTERGLLAYGRWSYRTPHNPNVRVVVTLETTNVGETTVERPAWLEDS